MENYRLTQTGEEVQDILNGAAMQTDLTAENERAEGAEQTLQGNIDEEERRAKAAEETLSGAIGDEELRAKAAEEALGGAIDGINAKIPAAASSENKLADQDFVNSSIETATATFRGTYNLVSDLHLAVDATHEQIATLLGTVIAEADNNDYSYVLVPTSAQTPTEIASIEKYTFGANGWAFAYALNNSGFTSAQWAAINSGITSGLVAKLNALPTNTDLLALLAGKQDVLTFDDVPVEGSNNPVKSGGVHSAIDDEKTARVNAVNGVAGRVDTIEGEIPAQASSENQLADKAYVNSSIATNTATYRGSFNLVADLGLSVSATHEQIGTALAGEILTADNNDYAYVQVPTSDETPSQILKVERYKFNGTAWAFEYELNNSGFTSAQWAALNSGITSGLVGKLNALPTNDELTLALAGKQDVLTFDNTPTENSNNPVKSGGVYEADKALSDAIEAILLLIPSAATSLNKLVDTDLMNSSISTATATFRGTFNLVSDLSLDLTATHAQIATALAGAIATADNNDYAFVQVPTSASTPTEIASTDRYKFNGTAWAYEYTLNTSGFTSAQWAAINSGITAALVASLADIPDLIPSEATSANQLADKAYVLAQILAATPAFKGQFVTLAELQAVASPKAGDLGIVRTKDSDGMDVFTVYQYLNNAWNVFYSLSYHPQTKPATTGTTGDYPYNGMGRVELAKNMVNTGTELAPTMVNQLTQDMFYKGEVGSRVPNTNTIFVIRYDYVLAENITIPDGCVLQFEGGSLSNGTITGNNTQIKAQDVAIFKSGIIIASTWNCPRISSYWFDDINANNRIKQLINLSSNTNFNEIYIAPGEYSCSVNSDYGSVLELKSNTKLIIDGTITLSANNYGSYQIVSIKNINNVEVCGSGKITGDKDTHTGSVGEWGNGINIQKSSNIYIHDIEIEKCWGDCIYVGSVEHLPSQNIVIFGCNLHDGRRQGISVVGCKQFEIAHCKISNISGTLPEHCIDVEPNSNDIVAYGQIHHNYFDNHKGVALDGNSEDIYNVSVFYNNFNCSVSAFYVKNGPNAKISNNIMVGKVGIISSGIVFEHNNVSASDVEGVENTFTITANRALINHNNIYLATTITSSEYIQINENVFNENVTLDGAEGSNTKSNVFNKKFNALSAKDGIIVGNIFNDIISCKISTGVFSQNTVKGIATSTYQEPFTIEAHLIANNEFNYTVPSGTSLYSLFKIGRDHISWYNEIVIEGNYSQNALADTDNYVSRTGGVTLPISASGNSFLTGEVRFASGIVKGEPLNLPKSGNTRPLLHDDYKGYCFFDTTTGIEKPIFYYGGGVWKDATGATV